MSKFSLQSDQDPEVNSEAELAGLPDRRSAVPPEYPQRVAIKIPTTVHELSDELTIEVGVSYGPPASLSRTYYRTANGEKWRFNTYRTATAWTPQEIAAKAQWHRDNSNVSTELWDDKWYYTNKLNTPQSRLLMLATRLDAVDHCWLQLRRENERIMYFIGSMQGGAVTWGDTTKRTVTIGGSRLDFDLWNGLGSDESHSTPIVSWGF